MFEQNEVSVAAQRSFRSFFKLQLYEKKQLQAKCSIFLFLSFLTQVLNEFKKESCAFILG